MIDNIDQIHYSNDQTKIASIFMLSLIFNTSITNFLRLRVNALTMLACFQSFLNSLI